MTTRQYLVQHILHLSAQLGTTNNPKEKRNIEQALVFYSKELQHLDAKHNHLSYKQ